MPQATVPQLSAQRLTLYCLLGALAALPISPAILGQTLDEANPPKESRPAPLSAEITLGALDSNHLLLTLDLPHGLEAPDGLVDQVIVLTAAKPFEDPPRIEGPARVLVEANRVLLLAWGKEPIELALEAPSSSASPESAAVRRFRGVSLVHRKLADGEPLASVVLEERERAREEPLAAIAERAFQDDTGGGSGSGGCKKSCSTSCYDGSECSASCTTPFCAACSCSPANCRCK